MTAIDHVGLAVPDLEAAIAFHIDVLGLRLIHREENGEQGVSEAMLGTADPASPPLLQLLAAKENLP